MPASASTTHLLSSPRSSRTLRKLQSAHALSSNYAALSTPSLISQQRQQQRNTSSSQSPGPSQIPPLPSQQSHHRTRSNSDAIVASYSNGGALPLRRNAVPKKAPVTLTPKDELETLVRQGPRGDVPAGLQRLRHLILCDGLDADNDGMVSLVSNPQFDVLNSTLTKNNLVPLADLRLVDPTQHASPLD